MKIELRNVSLHFGKSVALQDVSLQLEPDKVYGLLGRNGAGKTSMLSLLASFRRPTAGTVLVDGEDPFENDRLMSKIALIWNKKREDEDEKVGGMLEFAAAYRPNWDDDYARHLTDRFNLPRDTPVKALSRGMLAAMDVVIGLASRTEITMMDEAYLGLDAAYRKIFFQELMEDYIHQPRTFILSTHYIGEVEHLLEDVIILHQGGLMMHSKTEDLLNCGVRVTGEAKKVEEFVAGKRVLSAQSLGNTRSVVLYETLSSEDRGIAAGKGLTLERPPLQDLFVYLTLKGETQDG